MNVEGGPSYSGRVLGGRYLVGELLGRGGYGAVYAATQRDLGRPVAIKVLHGELSYDVVMRFEREARAAAALGHPNIVGVTDFSAQPGEPPFLVMELLPGETMGKLLRRQQRLPPGRVAWIAHQVLAALDAAHRAGIVHRDVKPDNVFLVSSTGVDDLVKLLDFGIAKLDTQGPTQLTATGAMLGSPAFMSPEQVKSGHVDPRTDLFAVGALMYFALAGRLPFDASSLHALLYSIAEGHPTPLASIDPSIDPRLIAIVERALQKDPAMRFQSAGEMRAALDPFVTRGVAPAVSMPAPIPQPLFVPVATPQRSNTGIIIGAIVGVLALLALLGGAAFFFLRGTDASPPIAIASASSTVAAPPSSVAATTTTTASAAAKKPGTAPPVTKTDAGVAPPPPSPVVDAGVDAAAPPPPVTKKQMAGTNPEIRGGTFNAYDIEKTKAAINLVMPAVRQCYVATEFDPPDHQFVLWVIVADAAGNVKDVHRKTDFEAHPKLDGCVKNALRMAKLPAMPKAGEVEINLTSRTKDNP